MEQMQVIEPHVEMHKNLKASSFAVTDIDTLAKKIESFLYGLLEGMSFTDDKKCKIGLTAIIYQSFQMFKYRMFIDPRSSMKFALATKQGTEAYNSIYGYSNMIIYHLDSATSLTSLILLAN